AGAGEPTGCKAAKTRNGSLKQCRNPAADVIVCENAHPALVDKETFAAVQKKLSRRRPAFVPGSAWQRRPWPVSGLLFCGDCGGVLWGLAAKTVKNGKEYRWRKYACSTYLTHSRKGCSFNTVYEDTLLDDVVKAVQAHFSDSERFAALEEGIDQQCRAHE